MSTTPDPWVAAVAAKVTEAETSCDLCDQPNPRLFNAQGWLVCPEHTAADLAAFLAAVGKR